MEARTIKEGESKKLKSTELHFYIPFIDDNTKTYQMLIIFKLLYMPEICCIIQKLNSCNLMTSKC